MSREEGDVMGFYVRVSGLTDLAKLSASTAVLKQALENDVERNVRQMANDGANNAPKKTGRLANSIAASPYREGEMSWSFGSDVEYARRQEFEHATKKAFLRSALWSNEKNLEKDIDESIKQLGR